MWPSHIRARTGDEMEWFPFQPTNRTSLEDVLYLSHFIFFPVATTHEIIQLLKIRLAALSQCL